MPHNFPANGKDSTDLSTIRSHKRDLCTCVAGICKLDQELLESKVNIRKLKRMIATIDDREMPSPETKTLLPVQDDSSKLDNLTSGSVSDVCQARKTYFFCLSSKAFSPFYWPRTTPSRRNGGLETIFEEDEDFE